MSYKRFTDPEDDSYDAARQHVISRCHLTLGPLWIADQDWGGQLALTCPSQLLEGSVDDQGFLIAGINFALNYKGWGCQPGEGMETYLARTPTEAVDLMGGRVTSECDLWLHSEYEPYREAIEAMLFRHEHVCLYHAIFPDERGCSPEHGRERGVVYDADDPVT